MKLIYTAILAAATAAMAAAPAAAQNPPLVSEPVPYTEGEVVEGDAALGEAAYAGKGCLACHGVGGVSVIPTYQTLAGKEAAYLKAQLLGFRSGARVEPTMTAMSKLLSDEEVDHVAVYLSQQPAPEAATPSGQ